MKNAVQVIPTSNGYLVTIPNASTEYAVVVEAANRDVAQAIQALGKAVMDLSEKALPTSQPSAPQPAAQ